MADGMDRGAMRDLAAEMGVLASVLIDNRALVTVRGVLGAEDFSAPRHAVIFETFVALRLLIARGLVDAEYEHFVGYTYAAKAVQP